MRLIFSVFLVWLALTFSQRATAQEPSTVELRLHEAPNSELAQRAHLDPTRALAQRSLRGPRWMIAGGSLLSTAALVAGVTIVELEMPADECLGPAGAERDRCQQRYDRDNRHATLVSLAVSLPLAFAGGALLGFGLREGQRIRHARRALGMASLDLGRDHASLGLRLRF